MESIMEFDPIYNEHYRPVLAFLRKMVGDAWTAEDLAQETFLKVRNHLNTLKDPAGLRSWIYSIARNTCRDHFRSRLASQRKSEDSRIVETAIRPMAQIMVEQDQMSDCVRDKMLMLPEHYREVLLLADEAEWTQDEIARELRLTTANVKARLHRARKAFRAILERECTFEIDERSVMVCLPRDEADSEEQFGRP